MVTPAGADANRFGTRRPSAQGQGAPAGQERGDHSDAIRRERHFDLLPSAAARAEDGSAVDEAPSRAWHKLDRRGQRVRTGSYCWVSSRSVSYWTDTEPLAGTVSCQASPSDVS